MDTFHDESHVKDYRPSEWSEMLEQTGFMVEKMEPYVKYRPLSSLTDNVSEKNTNKIRQMLNSFTDQQRKMFDLTERGGQVHLNHWYVMVSAKRS